MKPNNCEVLILVGIPGSGKSTYSKKKSEEAGFKIKICSADSYFMKDGEYNFDPKKLDAAHQYCFYHFLEAALWEGNYGKFPGQENKNLYQYIIVDNTNLHMEHISPYVAVAKAMNLPFRLVFFHQDPKVCAERNVHNVPESKVLKMHEQFLKLYKNISKAYAIENVGEES